MWSAHREPEEEEVLDLPQEAHEGRVKVDAEEVRGLRGAEQEGQAELGLCFLGVDGHLWERLGGTIDGGWCFDWVIGWACFLGNVCVVSTWELLSTSRPHSSMRCASYSRRMPRRVAYACGRAVGAVGVRRGVGGQPSPIPRRYNAGQREQK